MEAFDSNALLGEFVIPPIHDLPSIVEISKTPYKVSLNKTIEQSKIFKCHIHT